MPKKLSPSANKNIPVNKNDTVAESSALEDQLLVSGITNTATAPQTTGLSPLTTPLTDAISWPAIVSKAKAKTPQKSWATIASGGATSASSHFQSPQIFGADMASGKVPSTSKGSASASGQTPSPKTSWATVTLSESDSTSKQVEVPQISWANIASRTVPVIPEERVSSSSQPQTPWATTDLGESTSISKAHTTVITQFHKIKVAELFNKLNQINKNDRDYPRKITSIIYQINKLKIELSDGEKLTLTDFISSINIGSWSNIDFIHLFISLKFSGVFNKEILQDSECKQNKLFEKLVYITQEVIQNSKTYHRIGIYSYLPRIIKAISNSNPSLVEQNKEIISNVLRTYNANMDKSKSYKLNSDDIYNLVTSIYDLRKYNVLTQEEASKLAKPFIVNNDITKIIRELHNQRKQGLYLFTCRRFISKDEAYKNYSDTVEAIYNQAIDSSDPLSSNEFEAFCVFDEINYLSKINIINIENCNIEPLLELIEGKIHTLIGKPFFASFYISLYHLETTSFAKTKVYERLKKEYHACLNKNISKIDPASIAKIEAYIAKSKVSYLSGKALDTRLVNNLDLMLGKICSETSAVTRENCLASLDIFSHSMTTNIHIKYFEYFKERIIPILLAQYNKLTYSQKIQLVKVLPLTKNEKNDRICKQMISELHNTFMANTDEYMAESLLFLSFMTNLGDYNSDILPFIELSRKVLIIDETRNKSDLFKGLKFYSFAYAYLILQEKEKSLPQKQIYSMIDEMREKLALIISLIEVQCKETLFNDDFLMLNYAYALLKIDKKHDVNFVYTETNIQNDIYNTLAEKYKLKKGKDIQLEASLFGLPGVDIYLPKYKLALEIDGDQHYIGADNKSISGKSIIQKAILSLNGIQLINVRELTRRRSLILEEVKLQVDDFLHNKEASD